MDMYEWKKKTIMIHKIHTHDNQVTILDKHKFDHIICKVVEIIPDPMIL